MAKPPKMGRLDGNPDTLARIADVLGYDAAAFEDGSTLSDEAALTTELLRHWLAMDAGDKLKLIEMARALTSA